MLKTYVLIIFSLATVGLIALSMADGNTPQKEQYYHTADNECTNCHTGLEPIRDPESGMMQEILQMAKQSGHKGNDCIVCHGGNPKATTPELAHTGTIAFFAAHKGPKAFYPDPGSPWINEHTCGSCHEEQVKTQFTSLMFSEAGKIQGTQWGFGAPNGYEHTWANYDIKEIPLHEQLGSEVYKAYMKELQEAEPQVFPDSMVQLPPAPTIEEVEADPQKSLYTYIRQECQRCHTGVKGRNKLGEYRGIGCSSCHIPYSTKGLYEGNDVNIDRKEGGHPLVHSIQGTRECKVQVHNTEYSGIPVRTCVTCHNRGRRIGTSFSGLMETAYSSPFMSHGEDQEKTFTKNYMHLHADLHKDKGMLCQDCHTSGDVHSDGILAGTTMAPVEIECQDCHGTPKKYPWELPIGYGDEIAKFPVTGPARGVSDTIAEYLKMGTEYPKQDGYLLSARGNPMPHLVRKGDKIILHSAAGKDIELTPLKKLLDDGKLSEAATIAMVNVDGHINNMECYACHDDWAPQCYGCHIKIDYSKGETTQDWIQVGENHDEQGRTAETRGELAKLQIPGSIEEQRSYLRFEDPALAINGEHRVSPAIPGCQTTLTVIGKDGEPLLLNHIFNVPNAEGKTEPGQKALDIAVTHPHTVSKQGRTCESCHTNPKAMGYGIQEGRIFEDPSQPYSIDLTTADGKPIPEQTEEHINAISGLSHDWSRFVTEGGEQLQTVGSHLSGSRPLNNEERAKLDRRGVCMSCHKELPREDLAASILDHIKEVSGTNIDTESHNVILNKSIRISAWIQVLGGLLLIVGIIFGIRKLRGR